MDARSIAATVLNGGALTAATELPNVPADPANEPYEYDDTSYRSRVYYGVGKPDPDAELVFGPNIADWPEQIAMPQDLLLTAASAIYDPVTTTDELIPSGETSSYRSNPLKLAEFTLSRKDPGLCGACQGHPGGGTEAPSGQCGCRKSPRRCPVTLRRPPVSAPSSWR